MLPRKSRLTWAAIAPLSFLWFAGGPELEVDAESTFMAAGTRQPMIVESRDEVREGQGGMEVAFFSGGSG
jgi:hypothetical protein